MAQTGVFAVFENVFKFGVGGSEATNMKTVADLESFSVSFSNGIETWTPMDTEGWQRGLMTAKALKIDFKGKTLERQSITLEEYENLNVLYQSYKALGGNGTIHRMMDEIEKMDLIKS